jgi:para-nitrobenzyl esterase
MGVLLAGAVACAARAPAALALEADRRPIAATDTGEIVGNESRGLRAFFGIPYAAPPVGPLRWRPPAPAVRWTRPRDATRRGPACPQVEMGFPRATSEDCLTVNVWTPVGARSGPLPVLVWIHGGAFFQGSGGDDFYDGAILALDAQAVVVTMNYRLGPLGFMSHPALAAEAGRAAAPSAGLLDQQAALRWVQRNIAAFGGAADRVTIFGQSAGAWSVCSHLAMPGSLGLFARAIMQSGACSDPLYFQSGRANAQGEALARAVGCAGSGALACLRSRPVDAIIAALPMKRMLVLPPGVWWGPVIDGVDLPRQPLHAMRAASSARVPIILGWNRDEGILHTAGFESVTSAELESFVRDSFGDHAIGPVLSRYRRPTLKDAFTDVVTDGVFACSARRVARLLSAQGLPVFLYQWTRALDAPKAHHLGATHSVELFFLFGNPGGDVSLSPGELPLARSIRDAWGRFARSGDPSGSALPWAPYRLDRDDLMRLDLHPVVTSQVKQEVCNLWDEIETRGAGMILAPARPNLP